MEWNEAKEVKRDIKKILKILDFSHVKHTRIFCFRTNGSKSRAYARIWAFPKIFQTALNIEPAYVIEVLAKYYDKLGNDQKIRVLIHELLHIPKNFSGSLLPHKGRNRHLDNQAKKLFDEYMKKQKEN
jgi:predicted metallopeptidase